MDTRIVADGDCRFEDSESFRAQVNALRDQIRARYAEQLATAGFLRRLILKVRIAREFRRERKRLGPSSDALYSSC